MKRDWRIAPSHPRLLAIKCQVMQARGENQTAQSILGQIQTEVKDQIKTFSTDPTKRLNSSALAVGEAAAVCFDWDTALEIFTAYLDQHPSEPFALLSYGRDMVKAAEWQSLSSDLSIKKHVAAADLKLPAVYTRFDQVMMELRKSGRSADVERWCSRGEMIFQPTSTRAHYEALSQVAEDAAWSIAAILRSGGSSRITPIAEKFPQAALVLILAAWGMRSNDVERALTWARHAVELLPGDPINQFVLAQIAEKPVVIQKRWKPWKQP